MPLFCYWCFGAVNLFAGYLVQRRERAYHQQHHQHLTTLMGQAATVGATSPTVTSSPPAPTTAIGGMGVFLFIYSAPSAALMIAVFYEFANRDIWLNEPPASASTAGVTAVKAAMWPFLLRAFMELLVGVLASGWVLAPRVSTLWRTLHARWLTVAAVRRGPPLQKLSAANGVVVAATAASIERSQAYRQPVHQQQQPVQQQRDHHLQYHPQQSHQQHHHGHPSSHLMQQQQQQHSSTAALHSSQYPHYPHQYPAPHHNPYAPSHSLYSTASYQSVLCPQNSMVSLNSAAAARSHTGSLAGAQQQQQQQQLAASSRGNNGYPAAVSRSKAGKKRTAGYRRSGSSTAATAAQSVGLMAAGYTGNESML